MKMTINEVNVEGIILKTTAYKENDSLIHIYTKEYGKIGLLARGTQKITSKNARACQSLMISEMTLSLKKGLSSLIKANPLDYLRHIKENLESEIIGNYILEYFYRYIEENKPNETEYDILYHCLQALNNGYNPLLVYLLFNVFILDHNGVSIDVEGCVICGSSQVVSISLEDGGFLCHEHLGHHQTMNVSLLKAFRHIHKVSIESIDLLQIEDHIIKELIRIMEYYIDEYTGVNLKTKTFIRQIV